MAWYLSIGCACPVKYHIDLHTNRSQPTLFFDWLITSFETVLEVVTDPELVSRLSRTAIAKISDNRSLSTLSITTLHSCISMHDLPLNYTAAQEQAFVDTYIRRYKRLIEIIKEDRPIYFIRDATDSAVSDEQANQFVAAIKTINPACKFALIIIGSTTETQNNILRLKLSERELLPTDVAWRKPHLAWSEIWQATSLLSLS